MESIWQKTNCHRIIVTASSRSHEAMGEPQTMLRLASLVFPKCFFPVFYMVKRTNRKQSAEIELSSVDSITDDRNTTGVM